MATNEGDEDAVSSSSSSSPLGDSLPDDLSGGCDHCEVCNEKYFQPRVLACLHIFCEQCLNKLLVDKNSNGGGVDDDVDNASIIVCPKCQQETRVLKGNVSSLPPDYSVVTDVSDTENDHKIICTSCKAKENAVARCSDCANYLCPSCVSAHRYMRCFENHKVVDFKDIAGNSDSFKFQKPVNCPAHSEEILKYFCHTCQFPICDECIVVDHKISEHHFEVIMNVEQRQRDEMQNLITESRSKVQYCEDASCMLEGLLSELQMQHDNAKSHIEETFQTYKTILEKVKEEKLKGLDELHTTQELNIMDTFHSVEKTMEKIDDACKYATRLLNEASITEILLLKNTVGSQLLQLINNTPKPDVNACLEFETDELKFKEAVVATFGDFKKGEVAKENTIPTSSMHSSFESEAFVLPTGVLTPDIASAVPPNVDLSSAGFNDFTLSQLASLATDMSQASNSPLCLNDLLSSDALVSSNINALNNLTALAKLGSLSLNNQGQLLMNGQILSGYGLDNGILSRPPTSASPTDALHSPLTSNFDAASSLGVLLNGGPHGMSSRGQSPNLDANSLLNGSMSQLNGALSTILANSLLTGNGNNDLVNLASQGYPSPRTSKSNLNAVRIRFKFGQLGPGKGQFSSPHGFCLGLEEEIVVADTNNHRVQIFDKTGEFKYQFGIPGKEEGQLWYPRKVAVLRTSGKFVVCDRGNERSRMQIFTKTGHFIKKIAIRYIDIVAGLAITTHGHIVAVDSVSPTVFVISESGDLLRWFDCSEYMREPSDIAISGKEYFVCDFKGHCVVVFNEDGQFMRRIGCENITNYPNGIDISDAGDVLVGDSHGNRFHVAVFTHDGSLQSEYECPYVKVSRCCGLKITSEGYVVTLAKNNHHVLILNTLYII